MDSVHGVLLRADKFTKALVEIPARTRINLQGESARMDINLTGLVKEHSHLFLSSASAIKNRIQADTRLLLKLTVPMDPI